MKRIHMALIGILVLQLALSAFTLWPRQPAGAGASGAPLFGTLNANDISSLTIYDQPTSSLKLARQGSQWVLPDADNFPADSSKVTAFINKLVAVKNNRLITKTPGSQAQLKVAADNYAHRVDFQAGSASHTLYVGTSQGALATHVRADSQNEVYLADNLSGSDVSAAPSVWITNTYMTVASADVTGFTLKNAQGEFAFTKDSGGNWSLAGQTAAQAAGEKLNTQAISTFLDLFSNMAMNRPLGKTEKPEYGLAQPVAEVTLKASKDGKEATTTLKVGAKDATDNTYVAKSSASDYYVRISEYAIKDAIDHTRDGFLVLPPTPTPGAAGQLPAQGTPAAP